MHAKYDRHSDELISVFTDPHSSPGSRASAAQKLYDIHSPVVLKKIARQVFNPDDVLDISQSVWMLVLRPETLTEKYIRREGKFGAFLDAPIRWAILKHLDKLPYTMDESGNKKAPDFTTMTETIHEQNLHEYYYQYAVDEVIKPNLKNLEAGKRCVYISSEYDLLFNGRTPSMGEVARINGCSTTTATRLFHCAESKGIGSRSDDETSIYVSLQYRDIIGKNGDGPPKGKFLSQMLGISEAVFRTRLHYARKYLTGLVRDNIQYTVAQADHV